MVDSKALALVWNAVEAAYPGASKNPSAALKSRVLQYADRVHKRAQAEAVEPDMRMLCRESVEANREVSDA